LVFVSNTQNQKLSRAYGLTKLIFIVLVSASTAAPRIAVLIFLKYIAIVISREYRNKLVITKNYFIE